MKSVQDVLLAASRGSAALEAQAHEVAAGLAATPVSTALIEAFVTALATSLPAGGAGVAADQLGATRAALKGLGEFVRLGTPLKNIVDEALADAGQESATRSVYGDKGWRCPRCGSARVREEHTDRDVKQGRFVQLLCEACGDSEDGTELERWQGVA